MAAQEKAIQKVAAQFGCPNDYAVRDNAFGSPPGTALVLIGIAKGRRRSFHVSPLGEVKP